MLKLKHFQTDNSSYLSILNCYFRYLSLITLILITCSGYLMLKLLIQSTALFWWKCTRKESVSIGYMAWW